MAGVPVIVGKLRKRFIFDVSIAMGVGTMLGYWYWYGLHVPQVQKQDQWYLKYHAAQLKNREEN